MEFYALAARVFKYDEGDKDRPYKDSAGFWTIGRGHLIGQSLTDFRLSQNIIEQIFREDLAIAIRDSRAAVSNFDTMNQARQIALISMLFTLGSQKFRLFKDTISAIEREDWESVSEHILRTKWASDVDPHRRPLIGRDDRIAFMFRTGEIHGEYGV